jgi:hypothetical protein
MAMPVAGLAALPDNVFEGFGVGHVFLANDGIKRFILSVSTLTALKCFAIGGCVVALVLPSLPRPVGIAHCAVVLLLDSVAKGVGGYTNHAQSISLFILLIFGCSERRKYVSLREIIKGTSYVPESSPSEHEGMVWLAALMIIIPYSYIGFTRVIVGGADLFNGDALLDYVAGASSGFAAHRGWLDVSAMPGFMKAGFVSTTILEAASGGILFSRAFRAIWLIAMCAFHLMSLVLMNILFWENMLLSLVMFWPGWRIGKQPKEISP